VIKYKHYNTNAGEIYLMSNIIRGSMMLTGANYLSKILGIVYVIPFEALVGSSLIALYSFAYTPYSILISLSTAGIPLAMSKFVAKYNSLGDYRTGRKMLKSASKLMMLTGILAFLLLFFSAEWIAQHILKDSDLSFQVEDITYVIKMVSFALIIIPSMSIIRGFFQGYGSMGPTAVSVVMEQIVRILFLLGSVFIIIKVMDGSPVTAIGLATFSAFVGALGSLFVLLYFWKIRKPYLNEQLLTQKARSTKPIKELYKELFSYAGPFVLVGLATPIYQLIDQFTLPKALAHVGIEEKISDLIYSVIVLLGHKLVIIPVTVATGLSLALLPVITKSFTEKKRDVYIQQINLSLQTVMLITIPAAVGLSILGKEAYASFYGVEDVSIAGPLLSWYAPVSLFFSLFTVSASILQSLNKQNFALISLGAGIVIKLVCNSPFIYLFGGKGAVFATGLAVLAASVLNIWRIQKTTSMTLKPLYKRTLLIMIFTAFMTIIVIIIKWLFISFIFDAQSRLGSIITVLVSAGIGGYVYLWLCFKSTLLERVLGDKARMLHKLFP
jgi:O-antigen/teichoic acid export membrane protein